MLVVICPKCDSDNLIKINDKVVCKECGCIWLCQSVIVGEV